MWLQPVSGGEVAGAGQAGSRAAACGEDGSKPLEGLKQESQDPVTV